MFGRLADASAVPLFLPHGAEWERARAELMNQHAGELTTWGAGNLPLVLSGDCARSYRAVRFFRAPCEDLKISHCVRRSLRLSVLVLSLLGINHRVTLEDASYERAGPRHGAGLLFFGVCGGAEPRTCSARWW